MVGFVKSNTTIRGSTNDHQRPANAPWARAATAPAFPAGGVARGDTLGVQLAGPKSRGRWKDFLSKLRDRGLLAALGVCARRAHVVKYL